MTDIYNIDVPLHIGKDKDDGHLQKKLPIKLVQVAPPGHGAASHSLIS